MRWMARYSSREEGLSFEGETSNLKKVKLIATGGTIASLKLAPDKGALPRLSGEELLEAAPGVRELAELKVESFSSLPSHHLSMEQLFELAGKVKSALEEEGFQGVVVSMGTNILEEAAYMFDLTWDGEEPVVVTGALRNPSLLSSDGPVNIYNAVAVAAHEQARGMGVLVALGGEVHTARDVTKTRTQSVTTFQSPGLGPLGRVNNGRLSLYRRSLVREHISPPALRAKVELIKAAAGMGSELLEGALRGGADGLVIEGFGGGHVTPFMLPGIERALAEGVPVVLVSRCFSGELLEGTYEYEAGDKHLRRLGVTFGGSLSGQKARIKLTLVLSLTREPKELARYFPS